MSDAIAGKRDDQIQPQSNQAGNEGQTEEQPSGNDAPPAPSAAPSASSTTPIIQRPVLPTQTFARVIAAIRLHNSSLDSTQSGYDCLQGHERVAVDMAVQTIKVLNDNHCDRDAVEIGVSTAERWGLGTLIEAVHRYVDGRTGEFPGPRLGRVSRMEYYEELDR